MNEAINIYQTLNEREKYILEKLEIVERDLEPSKIRGTIQCMLRQTERISQLPITDEEFISALKSFEKSHDKFFKGIEFIFTEDDYPDVKLNIYNTLSENDKRIIKILGIKLEDKEITSKRYAEIDQQLVNNLLMKFGTGIKEKECCELIDKIKKFAYSN